MDILEILTARGLDPAKKTKFIRHRGDDGVVRGALEGGHLEAYQSFQRQKFFGKCQYIVSFIGDEARHARLFGVFEVLGAGPVGIIPKELVRLGHAAELAGDHRRYELRRLPGYEDLEGRAVIDWGKGALAWHQWACPKEVVQILPTGYVRPFPGYLDFTLTYAELREMVAHPKANRGWRTLLSNVAGVYLIVDTTDGQQYVGSAYGAEGIWGRWSTYVKTGHGGNVELVALLEGDPDRARHFHFTILRTLPRSLTAREVIGFENLYKEKLGTRAFGLNSN